MCAERLSGKWCLRPAVMPASLMINRLIRCRYCWRYHEIGVGSFAGHVLCPEAGEPSYHGQETLRCYECGDPPTAGHAGPQGQPACPRHIRSEATTRGEDLDPTA